MKHYKISKLLNDSTVSKLAITKWIEVNNLSSAQYSVNKTIWFKPSLLRSDLCDYSNAYTVVNRMIGLLAAVWSENNKSEKRCCF